MEVPGTTGGNCDRACLCVRTAPYPGPRPVTSFCPSLVLPVDGRPAGLIPLACVCPSPSQPRLDYTSHPVPSAKPDHLKFEPASIML